MGWKNWPYWLKGGLIGLLIGILIILHISIFGCSIIPLEGTTNFCEGKIEFIIAVLELLIFFPLMWLGSLLPNSIENFLSNNMVISLILSFIYFFLIGALIGLIIQKIKSRKK